MLLYSHYTVASAVNQKVHTIVASRGIIRVTVTIGDCQALSCCRYAVAPLLHRCQTVVKPQSLRPREGINNSILN